MDGDGEAENADEIGTEWPEELTFRGCDCWPELNGIFSRTRDFDHVNKHQRPTYQKKMGEARLLCFFWRYDGQEGVKQETTTNAPAEASTKKKRRRSAAADVESGWWLGNQMGSRNGLVGRCGGNSELPPEADWHLKPFGYNAFLADPGGFVDQERLGIEALQRLDLKSLQGHVVSPKGEPCARYFGHFCALLHLEYLEEVATLRRRTSRRSGEELERAGWALIGLRVREVMERQPKGKSGKGAGKGKAPGFQMSLFLSQHTDIDKLRFRKGDSVILSATHPLQDRFAEGQLQDLTDKWALLSFESVAPPEGCKQRRWRVDKGSNRLSYARQLDSLVSLCTGCVDRAAVSEDCSKIFDIINSGKVGQADSWASHVWEKHTDRPQDDGIFPTSEKSSAAGQDSESQETKAQSLASSPEVTKFGFKLGDFVTLHGLQSEALNNKQGEIVAFGGDSLHVPDPIAGSQEPRIHVKLNGSTEAVRLSNVRKVDRASDETHARSTSRVAAVAAEEMNCDPGMMERCTENLCSACTGSQREAVSATFQRRFTIIQGPPGTGQGVPCCNS